MRRRLAIGALIAAVGGGMAWWLIFDAGSPGEQAPVAGHSAGSDDQPDSSAPRVSPLKSPLQTRGESLARGESLEQSPRLAAPENQLATNAPRSADAAAAVPSQPQSSAAAGATPADKTRYPVHWQCIGMFAESRRDYSVFADSSTAWSGSYSARMESRVARPEIPGSGCYQIIAADELKGRRVEFSLYMRTLNAAPGAHLVFRAVGDGREVDVYETESRRVHGTSGWTRYSVVFDVPLSASIIGLGAMLENTGSLWIDDASLQVVTEATPVTQTPKTPGHNSWNPDPSKYPTALQNSGFEDTVELPPEP